MRYVVNPTMRGAYIHPEVYGNFRPNISAVVFMTAFMSVKTPKFQTSTACVPTSSRRCAV